MNESQKLHVEEMKQSSHSALHLCDVLETATGGAPETTQGLQRRDITSESLAVNQSCVKWLLAGKGGLETGFLQEMVLNKRALSTNRNKSRKGNTVIQTGKGRPVGKLCRAGNKQRMACYSRRKALMEWC